MEKGPAKEGTKVSNDSKAFTLLNSVQGPECQDKHRQDLKEIKGFGFYFYGGEKLLRF